MVASAKVNNINFLYKKRSLYGQVVSWAVTYGIILTVLVVLAVILTSYYEYHWTKQLYDTNQAINAAAANISAQHDFEYQFLLTQQKLDLYNSLTENEQMDDLFPKLNALTPSGVRINDLTIEPDFVHLIGFAASQNALTQFANNLNATDHYRFDDEQMLTITNLTAQEISQEVDSLTGVTGYKLALNFNYKIEPNPVGSSPTFVNQLTLSPITSLETTPDANLQ